MEQGFTWEVAAAEAVINPAISQLHAVLDSALHAGFCFRVVVASTSGAWLSFPSTGATEATIHSAGSNRIMSCLLQLDFRHDIGCLMIVFHFSGAARRMSLRYISWCFPILSLPLFSIME